MSLGKISNTGCVLPFRMSLEMNVRSFENLHRGLELLSTAVYGSCSGLSREQTLHWSVFIRKAISKQFLNASKIHQIKGAGGKKD